LRVIIMSSGSTKLSPHDRLLWLVMHLIGSNVEVTTHSRQTYVGILHNVIAKESKFGVILKLAKLKTDPVTTPLLETVVIPADKFAQCNAVSILWNQDLSAHEVNAVRGGHISGKFQTDTDISRIDSMREKELVAWTPDAHIGDPLEGLDEQKMDPHWDQFAAAKEMWGFQSTWDENLYTTPLNRTDSKYQEYEKKANRIAKEIKNQTTSNPHLAEERGQETEEMKNMDSEDRYSGVIRYVPPARRQSDSPQDGQQSDSPQTDSPLQSDNNTSSSPQSQQVDDDDNKTHQDSTLGDDKKPAMRADAPDFIPDWTPPSVSVPVTSPASPPVQPSSPSIHPHYGGAAPMHYPPSNPPHMAHHGYPPPHHGYPPHHGGYSPQQGYPPQSYPNAYPVQNFHNDHR